VLAYDTDVTEGEEKVAASDKKSAKKVSSSKKSTKKKKGVSSKHHKYRSRGRSARSSRSRPVIKSQTVTVNRRVATTIKRGAKVSPVVGPDHESHVVSHVERRTRGPRALQVVEGTHQVAPRRRRADQVVIKEPQKLVQKEVPPIQIVMSQCRHVRSMC